MHKANKSGSALEEVKFTDGQEYEAAVCTNSHEAQSKREVLGCGRRLVYRQTVFCLEILGNGGCCSITGYHQINPTKGYEFSIYIKSTVRKRAKSWQTSYIQV